MRQRRARRFGTVEARQHSGERSQRTLRELNRNEQPVHNFAPNVRGSVAVVYHYRDILRLKHRAGTVHRILVAKLSYENKLFHDWARVESVL